MRAHDTPSLIPVSIVNVYEDFSSLCQFRGVGAFTRSREYVWQQQPDGLLVTGGDTRGRNGLPATYTLTIDRERRVMTLVQHDSDGSVSISHNMARDTDQGQTWRRVAGDVGRRFDELVSIVLEQIANQASTLKIDV